MYRIAIIYSACKLEKQAQYHTIRRPLRPKTQRDTNLLAPKSAPLTLRLPPPVLPSFVPATLDAMLPSNDTLSVRDPTRPPAVTANTMLPSTPLLVLHTADVSDTHTVACMPDCPVRPRPLYLHNAHKTSIRAH